MKFGWLMTSRITVMRLKRIDECAVNRNDELAHRDLLLMFLFVRFRSLRLATPVQDITAYVQRVLPVELVEAARDDVLRRLVERLRDRVVALVRPVGGEDLVGPASQKHVELTGDSLANGLVQGVVPEGHDPASVGEPVPRILLGATGRLHDAVQCDLGNGDELSHSFSPVSLTNL